MNGSLNYKLLVAGYSGNIGYNAFDYHNGMMFTTYDRDNDPWTHTNSAYNDNCAVFLGGGFWYNTCAYCHVNGARERGSFRWVSASSSSPWIYLQLSRMWLTCQ